MSPETLVSVASSSLLRIRFWDEHCVVYDTASSTTHLIEQHAGLLLEWVCQREVSIASLSDRLASLVSSEKQEDVQRYVLGSVKNLNELGLLNIDEMPD